MRMTIIPASQPDDPFREEREREEIRAFADFLATLLDSVFRIPGTNIRIGLDPLLGLIPGLGDIIANLLGTTLLVLATQLGVPRIVIFRMTLNIFINTLIGAIPGIGDVFSVWFKSNVRNAALLRRYCRSMPPRSTLGDWLYVAGLIAAMLLTAAGALFALFWIVAQLWRLATAG